MPPTLADQVKRAEIAKLDAERRVLEEDLEEKRWDKSLRLSVARARRTYDFVADVDEFSIAAAVDELNDWVGQSKEPITLRLCSPGGSVFDGMMLYDFVRELRRDGISVVTYVLGYAASMGAVLSQAGTTRRIAKNAWFMVHEPSTITLGKASSIKDEAKLMERLHDQLVGVVSERSNLTPKQIKARCNRKDWWMSADEALAHGFFDELV